MIYKGWHQYILTFKNYMDFGVCNVNILESQSAFFTFWKLYLVIDNLSLCQSLNFLRIAFQNEIVSHAFNNIKK